MRRLTCLLVVGAVLAAGCSAPSATGRTPTAGPPEHRPFPAFPPSITAETAGPYAAEFEEVYRHNSILAAEADGITSISVNCEPREVTRGEGTFAVTVECGFSWMFESDGGAGIADGAPYRATYRVSGGLAERVGSTLGDVT